MLTHAKDIFKAIMYNEEVDFEEGNRGFSIFGIDLEVQSSHMKVPLKAMAQEEVRSYANPLIEPLHTNDWIDVRKELTHMVAPPEMPRKRRGIRPKKGNFEMIVGNNINLEQIPVYLNFSLVERFCGKVTSIGTL